MEDCGVYARSGGSGPCRQPHNAPSEARAQSDDGFARFLKQHSSPTHQRVTAGGRIVPMGPIPAPPEFNLLIDNLARGKDSSSQRQTVDDAKIGKRGPASVMSSAATPNADLPSAPPDNQPQGASTSQEQTPSPNHDTYLNTSVGGPKNENRMPRPSDLPHVTTAGSTGLPQPFTNFTSPLNLDPQALTHSQWGSLVFPSSGVTFTPYTNMLVPSGEQPPMTPNSILPTAPFTSMSGAEQMTSPINHGVESRFLGQHGLQPGLWANYNPLMPVNSFSNNQLSYPACASLNTATTSMGPSQGNLVPQIGTHNQAGYPAQTHATDVPLNSMTMNHSLSQASNSALSKLDEDIATSAESEYRQLDNKLQAHDQYTARHHSSFTTQLKSHYARERMSIVEQRDMARRNLMQLRAALDEQRSVEQRSVQPNLPCPPTYQQRASTKAMTSAFTQKSGNTNLNVQASAWVPKGMHQSNGFHIQRQSGAPNVSNPSIVNKSASGLFKSGSEYPSFAARTNFHATNPLANEANMQLVISPSSNVAPGPYGKRLGIMGGGELSDEEVDEWGVRRGYAPPEIAQKQSEDEMKLRSQQREEYGVGIGSALASLDLNACDSPMTASPYPVDEWGVRIGRAPPDVAEKQSEQDMKLAKMHPDRRSQISFAALDSLPSAKGNASKTVSFVESANTTYHIGRNCDEDASSVEGSDETGWRPMMAGEAPGPTQQDWQAMVQAGNQERGVKTEVHLATGDSLIIEGTRPPGHPISTANPAKKSDEDRKRQSVMSEEDRYGITKQLLSLEGGFRGLGDATRKPSSMGLNPWTFPDENNFFRNKGPSSVATQSVTASGTMPGVDGAVDRYSQKAVKPLPSTGFKINDSPFKSSSPSKRFLKDIWAAPSRRARAEAGPEEEEDVSELKKALYKY